MFDALPHVAWAQLLQAAGSLCQMATAVIAVAVGVCTFRFTKRQNFLSLVNQSNNLANMVNTTLIGSPQAREALGKLQDTIVGYPDDAILFMYLNYVHNTYRTYRIGAVSRQVWMDTLASCAGMMARLNRGQVEQLLGRGYEAAFGVAVLARYDAIRAAAAQTAGYSDVDTIKPFRRPQAA